MFEARKCERGETLGYQGFRGSDEMWLRSHKDSSRRSHASCGSVNMGTDAGAGLVVLVVMLRCVDIALWIVSRNVTKSKREDDAVRRGDVDAVCDGGLVMLWKMVCSALQVKFLRGEQGPPLLLFCSGFRFFSESNLQHTLLWFLFILLFWSFLEVLQNYLLGFGK
mgnify:CR=1 FL=1